MAFLSPEVERLLSTASEPLPLVKAALKPASDACKMRTWDATDLFPRARHGTAALAGLLLRMGCWAESHIIAQDINSSEGSYWHGIIHRMEPDSSNAAYWFPRVGQHAIFPQLLRRAVEILNDSGPRHWRPKSVWDPFLFIDWCDEAREKGDQAEKAAAEIQTAEWQLLFEWCALEGH
jgi:hypothetical protein